MALYSKKEFAKMLGMRTGDLTNYIKRGKVLQRPDGMIDDDELINLDFLQHRRDYLKDKANKGETPPGMATEIKKATTVKDAPDPVPSQSVLTFDNETGEPTGGNYELATLQKRKAKADLEKKLVDTKTATLNYQILKGKHIPTDMVRDVITELGKSIITQYKDFAESFLTEFSHRKQLSPDEYAEMKGLLVEGINTSHHKAVELAKKQVAAIVSDFRKDNKTQLGATG